MSRLRKYLTPSTFIAFLALIFAVTGGAFAASSGGGQRSGTSGFGHACHGLCIEGQAEGEGRSAGPRRPPGRDRSHGRDWRHRPRRRRHAGRHRPSGTSGPAGANGTNGANGEPGAKGENGTTGFTATLPPEKTETGVWSVAGNSTGEALRTLYFATVSFSIPLKVALGESQVHYITSEGKEMVPAGASEFEERESTPVLGNGRRAGRRAGQPLRV